MPLLKSIEMRRSFRALDEKPIQNEILLRLAEAARLTPSWGNKQPWRIVTVTAPSQLTALKATLTPGNYWAKKTPPAIAAFVTSLDWMGVSEMVGTMPFDLGWPPWPISSRLSKKASSRTQSRALTRLPPSVSLTYQKPPSLRR